MEKCGKVIWERGLLLKGFGLCHGVAGNGYSLLSLYQLTGHEYHLHRVLKVKYERLGIMHHYNFYFAINWVPSKYVIDSLTVL